MSTEWLRTRPAVSEIFSAIDSDGSDSIDNQELAQLLKNLSIDASPEEVDALFKVLDEDGSGGVSLEEFEAWYEFHAKALEKEVSVQSSLLSALIERRTVHSFSDAAVPRELLDAALLAAAHAPNHFRSEPWKMYTAGPRTITNLAALTTKPLPSSNLVIFTSPLSPSHPGLEEEDYAATAIAVQNFQLAMWVSGVGCKWTTGATKEVWKSDEFRDLVGMGKKERVVGLVFYGFPKGGIENVRQLERKKGMREVVVDLP